MPITATLVLWAVFRTLVWVLLCLVIADFLVGFVHWAEDRYGEEHWPVVGQSVIAPNLLHHREPRAFVANSWWQSADYQVIAGGAVLAVSAGLGWLSWQLALVVVLVVNANEVHKWAHRTRNENGRVISWLQDHGIVQSRAHHGRHHGGDRDSHYATLTNWVNPLLDRMRVWRGLEWTIATVTGVGPRLDPVVAQRRAG